MKKYILWGLLAILVLIQLIPADSTNPPADPSQDFFTAEVAVNGEAISLIKTACYDCHSHTTAYPWYHRIQPVAMWMGGHIKNGRKHVNFSEWGTLDIDDKKHKLKECMEVLEEKRMPMLTYMIAHGDAWISDDDRVNLGQYFKSRLNSL